MTKADLVGRVAEKTGLTKTDVAVVMDSIIENIKLSMEKGHNIEFRDFGTFKVQLRKARLARNPKTGESIPIPERKVPVFKPSPAFKGLLRAVAT